MQDCLFVHLFFNSFVQVICSDYYYPMVDVHVGYYVGVSN